MSTTYATTHVTYSSDGASDTATPLVEQPYETSWSAGSGTVTALVVGGTCSVDTSDLDSLALALTAAGDHLDQARLEVLKTITEVESAGPPPVEAPTHVLAYPSMVPVTLPGAEPAGGTTAGWAWGDNDSVPVPGVGRLSRNVTCMLGQHHAINALEVLADGPSSLAETAGALHDLASAVTEAADAYSGAESAVRARWATGTLSDLRTDVLNYASSPLVTILGLQALMVIRALTFDGALLDDSDADLIQVASLLQDDALALWAIRDLMLVIIASQWVRDAGTGTEAAAVEAYLADVAHRLNPVVTERLPKTVQVGSRSVPTSSLTEMQRVSAYLAMIGAASGARLHGARTGVVVSAQGGGSVTVPTPSVDPFALGTAVPVLTTDGTPVTAPATAADVIRYSAGLKKADTDPSTGVISVLRTDHADGTTSWLVVVPGTTDWGMGDSNPQDLLTNFEAVAGQPTDMESAVVTAMRAAGIQEGDPVAIYGHSQGAISVANVAADPAVADHFNITHLLTAGGPVAGAAVPDDVTALHLEDTADIVPALDAAPNPTSATRTTVLLDTTEAGIDGYPHGTEHYAQAVEHMDSEPALADFQAELADVTGAGEEGAVTTEYVFDITRSTDVTVWEQVAGTSGPRSEPDPQPGPAPTPVPVVQHPGSGSASQW
ncbi:hypothetical protein [Actinomyces respiraculi]|uniref:hypothetical protein n=1 Tax=Actinomyces respiraculi TaxID=2744574 RepID=UPI001422E22A|nr:hypothetical protein [Actinomyces respiraculi]